MSPSSPQSPFHRRTIYTNNPPLFDTTKKNSRSYLPLDTARNTAISSEIRCFTFTPRLLSSVGQDDLEPYEYACEVSHKLFKFKSLSSAQNYLFLAMPVDRSLMFVFQVFHWLV